MKEGCLAPASEGGEGSEGGVHGTCVTLVSLPIRRKRLPSVRVCCAHTHTQAGRDARTRHLDGRGQRGEGSQRAPEGAWVHGRYAGHGPLTTIRPLSYKGR